MTDDPISAGELLRTRYMEWANFEYGKSHVVAYEDITACGIRLTEKTMHRIAFEPTRSICGKCRRSRDWYTQGVLKRGLHD